ncbi:MAG: winged helix-turn-helix domain-containing protein [Pyrinomonadaceae bacterium]
MSLKNSSNFLRFFSVAEMNGNKTHSYRFKSFILNVAERQLLDADKLIPLTPKSFDTLVYLVERSGHLIEKEELMQSIWTDSFVEEGNLSRTIHDLRRALGQDKKGKTFIETIPTKGYRFVATVNEVREPNPDAEAVDEKSQRHRVAVSPRPDFKPKQKTRIILFTVGFASAIFLILLLSFNFRSGSSVNQNDVKSIAILPLKPLTAENREPIYEFGIADSLINKLSSAKGLIVRPLSATRRYADIEQDAIAAGREQQVNYVLASNYQILGGKIRITSQLINVQSGLVEEVFKDERENSSGFAVQDAVAANIGQLLLKKLNREPNNILPKRYTANEEAYRLYLQGTALADKRNQIDVRKAVEYFEQAIQLDPNYALAYAGLANAHTAGALEGGGNSREQYPKAKAAIEKALAIDDNLAEAHSYSAEIKFIFEWDFAGAEREHKRAIALNPNSSAAHRMYALLLGQPLGRFDEAIAEIKTAIDLEPASVLNHKIYGQTLYFARRYDEAIAQLKRTVEMDAEFSTVHKFLINSYSAKGDEAQAFEWFVRQRTQFGDKPDEIQSWKTIYAKSGWRGIFERQLEQAKEAEKNGKPNYIWLAFFSIELGEREPAFAYLEKAFVKRQWAMTTLKVEPRFDPLRSDPRFEDLVKRVGLN